MGVERASGVRTNKVYFSVSHEEDFVLACCSRRAEAAVLVCKITKYVVRLDGRVIQLALGPGHFKKTNRARLIVV